ncbi:MAG TPA: hypothetical protein DIW47_15335 [Bacteroidetes bacterium]|nr:hypothetical protein [Bacteroidota bacterium]
MEHKNIYEKRKAQFYKDLKLEIDRAKVSYTELSKNLPMYSSKQAFGQALNNQTLKLEALFAIADGLDKHLLIRFLDTEDSSLEQTLNDPESLYAGKNQKLNECREQLKTRDQIIQDLRESLRDKQMIIDILQKQLENKKK